MTKAELDLSEKLFNEGIDLYEQEKFADAEVKYLEALQLHPVSEEIMYNLALVYFEQKKYDLSYALADRIQYVDCSELFEALEQAGFEPQYPIPDDIPETCASCEQFRPGSMIKDEGGFCLFYQQHVHTSARCLVYTLVDEGKVRLEDIEKNRNKRRDARIKSFVDNLNEQILPTELNCEKCGARNTLSQSARNEKRFTCSSCSAINDINMKIDSLSPAIKQKPDKELFTILIQSTDFELEYLLAARKEIIQRNIKLAENEKFIEMIS